MSTQTTTQVQGHPLADATAEAITEARRLRSFCRHKDADRMAGEIVVAVQKIAEDTGVAPEIVLARLRGES